MDSGDSFIIQTPCIFHDNLMAVEQVLVFGSSQNLNAAQGQHGQALCTAFRRTHEQCGGQDACVVGLGWGTADSC